ncbi:metallophosphoesterase, partial [Bifidobacterium adolescentis]
MTTLFVGDIHLKSARVLPAVDRAVAMTGADGVVFLGDICDDWGATAREAVAAVR